MAYEREYEKLRGGVREIYRLKLEGYTDKNIAKYFGISIGAFQNAIEIDGVVKDTYDSAMEILCAKLMNVVMNRALGTDGATDKEGNPIPPDHNLAFRLLEKIDPRFRQKEEKRAIITIEQVIREVSAKKGEVVEIDMATAEVKDDR